MTNQKSKTPKYCTKEVQEMQDKVTKSMVDDDFYKTKSFEECRMEWRKRYMEEAQKVQSQ